MRRLSAVALAGLACALACVRAIAAAQPSARGGGGHGRFEDHAPPTAAADTTSWIWIALGALVVAVAIALVVRTRGRPSVATPAPTAGTSTFALRAVAGALTWLGGLAAILGLLAGVGIIVAGLAADHGLLGLLGAAVPAVGGGVLGLVVMAVGQLLGCIAAIEAHTRSVVERVAANVEETARLRAVVMARLSMAREENVAAEASENAGATAEEEDVPEVAS